MGISFNQVPNNVRVPFTFVEFNNAGAVSGAQAQPYKALVIGQRLSTGTVSAAVPTLITSVAQARTAFGAGSMLADMIAAFLANNTSTELWAIAADDNVSGVKAVGSVKMTGTASAAGTIALYIGGVLVTAAVASGDTPATQATSLAAAITALASSLPVAAAVDGTDTTKVNITYNHKGLVGNFLDLRVNYQSTDAAPAGVTFTIVQPTGGTTDPDLTALIAAMGDISYNVIAHPYTAATALTALEAELVRRWGPSIQIDGMMFTASNVSYSSLVTLGQGRNSQYSTIVECLAHPTAPWNIAAMVAATVAFYGSIDPARPFQTLPLVGALGPAVKDRLIRDQRNLLLYDGISTLTCDAGGVVRIERLITTYETNGAGAADPSYLDVNTLLNLSYLRWSFRNYFAAKYPRHKLGQDGTRFAAGQAIMTPSLAKAECISLYQSWIDIGLVQDIQTFKSNLVVQVNASNPSRLDFLLPPKLIGQLVTLGAQIAFLL